MSAATISESIALAVRAHLDRLGLSYTQQDVQEVLREQMPGLVMGMAEQILLMLPPDESDDDDEAQADFDAWMTTALEALATILRAVFEGFGPVDEAVFSATWKKSQAALLHRLQALSTTMQEGGCA